MPMSFRDYLITHYTSACDLQREIESDAPMVKMLRSKRSNPDLVSGWMRNYGLFQGIEREHREAAVQAFLAHAASLKKKRSPLTTSEIEDAYRSLLLALHQTVERGWVSAASKLLWCVYPNDFVIYDTFVHRTLVVLQCIDRGLGAFPRIGMAPKIKTKEDIQAAVAYYMNFQSMVKHLQSANQKTLDSLRAKNSECYLYDIRIIDKLLWMMGNAKHKI